MGYMHIENLYRPGAQRILAFRELWALEKVHGTSAHVAWGLGQMHFFSGGEKHESFVRLFDADALRAKLTESGHTGLTVYGEAYGGRCQGMSGTYGKELRFIAFDVQIGESWLSVPDAAEFTAWLGLEFVPHRLVPSDLPALDAERDRPSEVAVLRGCGEKPREGVVLHPPFEVTLNGGHRLIVKHKGEAFRETASPRAVLTPEKIAVFEGAEKIAAEFVVPERLRHVLDRLGYNAAPFGLERMRDVLDGVIEDVLREGSGEFADTREVRSAISRRAAEGFKVILSGKQA